MTEAQRNDLEYLESVEFPSPDEREELLALYELQLDERLRYLKAQSEGVPA